MSECLHIIGCLYRALWDWSRPRCRCCRLRYRAWQRLLDSEEFMGSQLGRVWLHQARTQRGEYCHREMRYSNGSFLPCENGAEPSESWPESPEPRETPYRVRWVPNVPRGKHLLLRLPVRENVLLVGLLPHGVRHLLRWRRELLPPQLSGLWCRRRLLPNGTITNFVCTLNLSLFCFLSDWLLMMIWWCGGNRGRAVRSEYEQWNDGARKRTPRFWEKCLVGGWAAVFEIGVERVWIAPRV